MEIVFVYQRLRKEFGRAPKFHDMPADILAETMPNPDLKDDYVERNPTDVAIQCIPEYSEHEVFVKPLSFPNTCNKPLNIVSRKSGKY
jgi:dynein intermediate chain 2